MKNYCLLFFILLSINAFCQSGSTQKDTTSFIEINPEFPGGIKAFYKYINKNFNYPKSAIKAGYMGRVIVKFIIEKDGRVKIDNINSSEMVFRRKKATEELRQLAIKEMVVAITNHYESMPIWKPGTQNGTPVRVFFTTPLYLEFQ